MNYDVFENPLSNRYASQEMNYNWSSQKKFSTWRRLWVALAKAEKELGLDITNDQIKELEANIENIDFKEATEKEKELHHDVMSHIYVYGEQCPAAKPIIHLGATSCYVTDNTEQLQMRDGLGILKIKLSRVISKLVKLAKKYADLPTLGFTHFQPAQLTTVGKRFSLYLQDFLLDLQRLNHELDNIFFRGIKGATGTQASYLALFDGNYKKVEKLAKKVAELMDFKKVVPLSGQTYTRKLDYFILTVLSGIAQSAYKFAGDMRLLSHLREIEEPFSAAQVGSSAMPYKRNPILSERVCALSRYVISLPVNCAYTHASQWFERTLDDSANRRIVLPEAFLATDSILLTMDRIISGLQIWEKVIASHVKAELPFMATENILMLAVKAGGDRQQLHEAIRQHSMTASRLMKKKGKGNDLIDRIKVDPLFAKVKDKIDRILDPKAFIGCAPEQVRDFLRKCYIQASSATNKGLN